MAKTDFKAEQPGRDLLRLEPCREGLSAARHHKAYLSDPRRTAPARLKTVLRQPEHRVR